MTRELPKTGNERDFQVAIAALCDEYERWRATNNKPRLSADEQYYEAIDNDAYTDEQRAWLKNFCERWEQLEEMERAS